MNPVPRTHESSDMPRLPSAQVKRRHGWSIFWLIPIAAAGIAAWLVYRELATSGVGIQIWFQDVSGLEPDKSQLKFRGVNVGLVRKLALSTDRQYSIVTATLEDKYKNLASEGSEFWIVRPEISGQGVSGLGTLVSQNYIEVRLGGSTAPRTRFMGRSEAPPTEEKAEAPRGLRVNLLAPEQWGLKKGVSIYYRGIPVGTVLNSRLETDAVRFEVVIREPYDSLVRMRSKFWKIGGIQLTAGLFSGVNLEVSDLKVLVEGGIQFATPPEAKDLPAPDTVFRLFSEPKPEWKEWRSGIPIAGAEEPGGASGSIKTPSEAPSSSGPTE